MMKMTMRGVDKSQITTTFYRWTGPGGPYKTYNTRTALLHAGFRTYAAMAVGGSGGNCTGAQGHQRGAGGGGGAVIRVQGNIRDLPDISSATVGQRGVDQAAFPMGGGSSDFNGVWAGGGGPASYIDETPQGSKPSKGGVGGTNYFGAGSPGQGGSARSVNYGNNIAYVGCTQGTYVDLGGGNGGGCGGGGGAGRSIWADYPSNPTGGANGAMAAAGGPGSPVRSNDYGGCGGGANVASVTGANEYYGADSAGAVVLRFS
jgi:hypothetical protein